MKKLMIAAAIVCAAAFANAAGFNWCADGVENALGTGLYSGAVTVYMSGAAEDTFTTDMEDGSFDFEDGSDYTSGSYSFYYTMIDADGNTFTSGTKTKSAGKSVSLVDFGSKGTWTMAPEPTSAMLLLLGMAGLALKRRRA